MPYFNLLRRLSIDQHISHVVMGPDNGLIILFTSGFFLYNIDNNSANADLLSLLATHWAQGDWLEAAALGSDVISPSSGASRYFLRWGADSNFRTSQNSLSQVLNIMNSASESNLQMFLLTKLLGNAMLRRMTFRRGQMRQAMLQQLQESHENTFNLAGMVDLSNLQNAAQVEHILHQWLDIDVPKARTGTGNLRRWRSES